MWQKGIKAVVENGGIRGQGLLEHLFKPWRNFRPFTTSGRNLLWAYLLILNMNLVMNFIVESGWYRPVWWPVTLWHSLNTYLLLGPLLYLLGRKLAGAPPLRWWPLMLHASPFLFAVVYSVSMTDLSLYGWELSQQAQAGMVDRFNPLALSTATHFSIYLAAAGWFGANLWASQRKQWSTELWLLILVVGLSLAMMVSILVTTVTAMVLQLEKSIHLLAGSATVVIAIEGWLVWLLLSYKEKQSPTSASDSALEDALVRQLQAYLDDEKPFLDPELSASTLASQVGLTRHQLSSAIARIEPEGFYTLVNRLRIEEVQALIRVRPDQHLIQIAYACGFNSKSTFNLAFKKITGRTPSQFRAEATAAL